MSNRLIRTAVLFGLVSFAAIADAKQPWEEYSKQIKAAEVVGTLGNDMFGDQVNFYQRTLSFSQTDISVPGNFAIPVALTRTFEVTTHGENDGPITDRPFSDWDLDIPRISGTYATTWDKDRCDDTFEPAGANSGGYAYAGFEFWQGLNASMPGGGEMLVNDLGAPKPAENATRPYKWVTSRFTYFSCIEPADTVPAGVTRNDKTNGIVDGQGFLAVTADGTKYWFTWMAQTNEAPLESPMSGYQLEGAPTPLPRKLNSLYVTRIEDRFGNWVTYTYDPAQLATQPVRLNSIQSSDGRSIALTRNARGQIATATSAGRTWTYNYVTGGWHLVSVTLPDTRQWTFNLTALASASIPYYFSDDPRNCDRNDPFDKVLTTGTMTHPSGAVGEFSVEPHRVPRTHVPKFCVNWEFPVNTPSNDIPLIPKHAEVMAISRKKITGAGLGTQEWAYDGGGGPGQWESNTGPGCKTEDCMVPKCTDPSCAGRSTVTVTASDGSWLRYKFGNTYGYDEGKLLKVERGGPEGVLETEDYTYHLDPNEVPVGTSLPTRGDGIPRSKLSPQLTRIVSRDGANFTSSVNLLDQFGRATNVDRFSSLGFSKTETTEYEDYIPTTYSPSNPWVLGQVKRTTTDGVQTSRTEFDARHLPWRLFGTDSRPVASQTPQQILTYNTDGTVLTVADGLNHVTTLSSWKRGIPQSILRPDSTTESAVVDDKGWLLSVTDRMGTTTGYDYDPMGRLKLINYTNSDTVVWNDSTRTFAITSAPEYGLAAGHWKQTVSTGNGRTTTWLNARWQPVLALTEDAANAATRSYVVTRYDVEGRVVFTSYPVATLTDANAPLPGIATTYDSLGRITKVAQDAETTIPGNSTGKLVTTTAYLAPFQTLVTNPEGVSTRTSYQAFDSPSTDAPTTIVAAENRAEKQTTTIVRDDFGKPTSMTRAGLVEVLP